MKSYGVTIQMKPLWQYFCMVPFVFQYFKKLKFGLSLNFDLWNFLGGSRLNQATRTYLRVI